MLKRGFCLFLLALVLLARAAPAQDIVIRLSLKVIVHPTTGARPSGITNAMLQDAVASANNWLAGFWRGYRYSLTEIVDIGGPSEGGSNGPSRWFGADPRAEPLWSQFQGNTQSDGRFQLQPDQLNFYITMGPVSNTGGACPISGNPSDAGYTACWALVNGGPWWLIHEPGHYFGLYHTFGGNQCPMTTAGDDGISDTLPEVDCWSRDQIANNSFGMPYASLTSPQQIAVDDTYFNAMSYHNAASKDTDEDRMTEMQLDREADTANGPRFGAVSGKTRFVSPDGSDFQFGTSGSPYATLDHAATVANPAGGDIILLRPGNYYEIVTLSTPCVIRVSRAGKAVIGTP